MSDSEWRPFPVGMDAGRWVTRSGCKTLLVVVHTVTSGQRLLSAARLVENDLRVQVVFTRGPDAFGAGVDEFLDGIGAARVPWRQAVRTEFDLALAAGYGGLAELHAPVVVMPHGIGHTKLVRRGVGRAVGERVAYGLDPQRLVRDGTLVPAALVLPHEDDLAALGRSCPEAVPAAHVVGDPSFDVLAASLARRSSYQVALGAGDGRKLVVVCSTWGPKSLLGRRPDLWSRLLDELPEDEYQVVTLLHPHVWAAHGSFQVRTWLAGRLRRGLSLVPPEADWIAVLAAADWIVGDQGSATVYGAAAGVPVLLGSYAAGEVAPGSAAARLAEVVPRIGRASLTRQLAQAAEGFSADRHRDVVARITSRPGRFDRLMRRLVYRRLRLPQPPTIAGTPPADPPFLTR
ncbi:hypothetical protein DZF91_09345 [Actinomadura logoneensis]|uniref:Uncharacterized protein n=1 Tax=Actinomadura logoneensis TaxID=2293572 RepID=A0A372JPA9_9ACTN|nr:hypothetical protein [Actinomadura logoneensis]RFU41852.1 hypothetical protein DZF91_09345 [Actinomadura logoneensis]